MRALAVAEPGTRIISLGLSRGATDCHLGDMMTAVPAGSPVWLRKIT